LSLSRYGPPPTLPSFPTRRSSDLFHGTRRTVEAHALDRTDLHLYGKHVAVDFLAFLRGQETFASMEELLGQFAEDLRRARELTADRKSTRLNSSHVKISYAVFCLK